MRKLLYVFSAGTGAHEERRQGGGIRIRALLGAGGLCSFDQRFD
jgi:hypothetical protein